MPGTAETDGAMRESLLGGINRPKCNSLPTTTGLTHSTESCLYKIQHPIGNGSNRHNTTQVALHSKVTGRQL